MCPLIAKSNQAAKLRRETGRERDREGGRESNCSAEKGRHFNQALHFKDTHCHTHTSTY